jgi:aspartate/methionine/tyrosine aminotransferase
MFNADIFNSATIEGMLTAPGAKWHRDPPDVIPLWLADPDFPTSPAIRKAIQRAVDDEDFVYGDDKKARAAVVEKTNRLNGLKVAGENIMITQGVIPSMWLTLQYATKPGDEVVVTDPMYFPFFAAVETCKTKPVFWKLDMDDGYKFDPEKLKALITPKTKAIFVCNPHNPSGRVMTKEELKAIGDIAVDKKITIMVDELWEDILLDGRKHITLASLSPEIADTTITSFGFSKMWGVPGLQVGYIAVTNMAIMAELNKIAKGVLRGTNNIALAAVPEMCDYHNDYWKRDMMAHLEKMRAIATRRFTDMGCKVPELQGTYLMFPKFPIKKTSVEFEKHLRENAKVALSTGSEFGAQGESHMRVLIATSESILNESLDRIEKGLKSFK